MALPDFGADLVHYLDAQISGLTAGTNLFRGQFPQTVVNGVLVVETGGERSDRPLGYVTITAQITSRSQDYVAALTRARALYDLLNEPASPRTMGATGASKVTYSKAIQPPFSLGQDERQAWRIVFNAEFQVRN